jgi:hypothetical protein
MFVHDTERCLLYFPLFFRNGNFKTVLWFLILVLVNERLAGFGDIKTSNALRLSARVPVMEVIAFNKRRLTLFKRFDCLPVILPSNLPPR